MAIVPAAAAGDGRRSRSPIDPEPPRAPGRLSWATLLRRVFAHPGYISWEEHEDIEHRLEAGAKAIGFERRQGQPREGPALLQGRVVWAPAHEAPGAGDTVPRMSVCAAYVQEIGRRVWRPLVDRHPDVLFPIRLPPPRPV